MEEKEMEEGGRGEMKVASSTLKKCLSCKCVSYCNKSCQKEDWTRCHKQDCKALKRIHPKVPGDLVQLLSQVIRKQRKSAPCTTDDEDYFPTTVDQLESHHEKLTDTRRNEFENLLFPLKQFIEPDVFAEPSSLLKIFGAANCNNFTLCDNDLNFVAIGIYLRASMANHSCDYNCVVVYDERKLQLRTIKDVKEGEECTIGYLSVMEPAKERQAELEEEYHFTCECVKCVEEINALGPGDGLGELELRGLKKSLEKMQAAENSQDILLLELCKPYLKPMDLSSSIPANHHLLMKVRFRAFGVYMLSQEFDKAAEIGKLNTEPYRFHYGPYSPGLGLYLLRIGKLLLSLKRIPEARKYLTEALSVLEVTHGPHHSLMKTESMQELLLRCRFPEGHPIWLNNSRISL
ncbi:histone-lysine N-methyltransferase SMYD3-like [Strongylocentrotus purpuratus]|uniref:Uncharacterized protein n=1 Tax=Strongylocentrotus purpuratus TaxID=7668 RepID=A0A7M7PQQ9_STRPU|nr:histone-lysine N-methyltransferase SMYD3-like [Strongylocentrotus purpuratus]